MRLAKFTEKTPGGVTSSLYGNKVRGSEIRLDTLRDETVNIADCFFQSRVIHIGFHDANL